MFMMLSSKLRHVPIHKVLALVPLAKASAHTEFDVRFVWASMQGNVWPLISCTKARTKGTKMIPFMFLLSRERYTF